MTLTETARHRTVVARLAATVSHDLGNILTLLHAGHGASTAESTFVREGVARLEIFSDVIAALDRGSPVDEVTSPLKPAVFDAIKAIRGGIDVDLIVDESRPGAVPECNIPGAQLTAAVYAALDTAARAARSRYPVRIAWLEDACFAGIRIDVPAARSMSSFESMESPGKSCRFGLEQALALAHKFGGYGLYELTENASHVELRWRKVCGTPFQPSGAVKWFGPAATDVTAMVPAVAAWSRCSEPHILLGDAQSIPRAVLGLVTPDWNNRPVLESLRWIMAAGGVVLPLVTDLDAETFITEEFGADCPRIRWPVEMKSLSEWAARLNDNEYHPKRTLQDKI